MRCKKSDCFNCPYPDCINDYIPKQYPKTDEQREKLNAWFKQKRAERRTSGMCPYCGKRPPDPGYKTCSQCRSYFRTKRTENKRKNGVVPRSIMDGVERCAVCGKGLPEDGYRLCRRCLENARRALDKVPTHNGRRSPGGMTKEIDAYWRARRSVKNDARQSEA